MASTRIIATIDTGAIRKSRNYRGVLMLFARQKILFAMLLARLMSHVDVDTKLAIIISYNDIRDHMLIRHFAIVRYWMTYERIAIKKNSTYSYERATVQCVVNGGAVGWGTALQTGRSGVRFPMVSLEFFIDIILPAALWPFVWLSL